MKNINGNYVRHLNELFEINRRITTDTSEFIKTAEKCFHQDLRQIAHDLVDNNIKLVLLTGPSSSGKTTTAHLLAKSIDKAGSHGVIISLDDFYGPSDKAPLRADGSRDYECVESLRINKVIECLSNLVNHSYCDKPIFDFNKHVPKKELEHIELQHGQIAIVEGLHALNPMFSESLPKDKTVKAFITVRQGFNNGEEKILQPNQVRLIRRIVRDASFRNTGASQTLSMWKNVRDGEYKYIEPFREQADIVINSLHGYEIGALKQKALSQLKEISPDDKNIEIAENLITQIQKFKSIPQNLVPKTSLLREFLGGGLFD